MKFMRAAPVIIIMMLAAACGGSGSDSSTTLAEEPAVEQADGEPASDEPAETDATASEPPATEATVAETAVVDDASADDPDDAVAADTTPETEEVLAPVARPDPCSLWTASELEAATGLSFSEGEFNNQLSVQGQEICDWIASGGPIANAQVLVLAPGLDYDFLRSGTDVASGPVTDIDVAGADAAHISIDGRILGIGIGDVVVQLAYLPPAGVSDTGPQLTALAAIAASRMSGVGAD